MTAVHVGPYRLAGGVLLTVGVLILWIMIGLGTQSWLPPPFRVVAFAMCDVVPGLFFILLGVFEMRASEHYEIVRGGQELRITRTRFFRTKTASWSLAGREIIFLDRGLAGPFGGTWVYDLRLREPESSAGGDWVGCYYHDLVLRLVAMFEDAGCPVRFDGGQKLGRQ